MPHRADAALYDEFRPHYPAALFEGLRGLPSRAPLKVCDLGAGTGLASASWILANKTWGHSTAAVHLTLVDPDFSLLQKTENQAAFQGVADTRQVQSAAENTPLDPSSQDLILIGSAVHWMNTEKTAEECVRLLRPGGKLLVFEYQFPKSVHPGAASLNEWVRRQFNEKWRAPEQRPRGKFSELLEPFSAHSGLRRDHGEKVQACPMVLKLNAQDFSGLLFSQSRTQHFEATLSSGTEVLNHRKEVREKVQALWPEQVSKPSTPNAPAHAPVPASPNFEITAIDFDFKLQFASFTASA